MDTNFSLLCYDSVACPLFPGPQHPLFWQMRDTYNAAVAPGTARNRANQARTYVKFMLSYDFPFLSPSVTQLAMFTQFLANSFPSPATVKNSVSGAKTWLSLHGGDTSAFFSLEAFMMSKAISASSKHVPSPASPLTPEDIHNICIFIDNQVGSHPAVKAAILVAYASFLRVSNILSPSLQWWGGPHTLTAGDITCKNGVLTLRVRSTKTRRNGSPHILTIFPTQDPSVCPVRAWVQYVNTYNPCPLGPAFILGPGKPLTPGPVVFTIRAALEQAGHPDPASISFHSLRRGAAQAAARAGASIDDLMYHGTWSSPSGLRAYVPVSLA